MELVSPSYPLFQKSILGSFRPYPNSNFNVVNFLGLTYLIKLYARLCHLCHDKIAIILIIHVKYAMVGKPLKPQSTTFFTAHELNFMNDMQSIL